MKNTLIFIAMLSMSLSCKAQITVAEPEFTGTYYHLTSDSTFAVLPKENGSIKKHENKVKKWSKLASGVSNIAGAAGIVGVYTSGSASGVLNGARVVGSSIGVSSAAESVSALAGADGQDIVFGGNASSYVLSPTNGDIRIIVKEADNETNPVDIYRIVRLTSSKKDRRVKWIECSSSFLGTAEAEENGYVNFSGAKYGEQSYLLTIPGSTLTDGQYAIFYLNIESALAVPVATFGIE